MAEPLKPLLTRRRSIGATVETTSGTFIASTVPLAATEVFDVKCDVQDFFADTKRTPQGLYGGESDAAAGKQMGKISFKIRVRPGDQTLPLLTGASMVLAAGTYSPTSDIGAKKTWSVDVWEDGRVKKMAGCSWNVKFTFKAGSYLIAEFDGMGIWEGTGDTAMPAQAALNAAGYVCLGTTLTFGGTALPMIETANIDLGMKPEPRESIVSSYGVISTIIGNDFEPKITLDPEARRVADSDSYGALLAGTTGALVIAVTSNTHTFTITAARAQRRMVADQNRGTRAVDQLDITPLVSAGDDALTLNET